MNLLTFPARPINGGHIQHALPLLAARCRRGAWSYEPKYNGWRAMVHCPSGAMWNRHGQPLSITAEFAPALGKLARSDFEWLDVEALSRRHKLGRGSLIVLDCPGIPLDDSCYVRRAQALYTGIVQAGLGECLLQCAEPGDNSLYIPPAYGEEERDELWQQLQDFNRVAGCEFYEGLVAKRDNSLYPIQLGDPNRETTDWVKHRFVV
jgi:hypothetical protein